MIRILQLFKETVNRYESSSMLIRSVPPVIFSFTLRQLIYLFIGITPCHQKCSRRALAENQQACDVL